MQSQTCEPQTLVWHVGDFARAEDELQLLHKEVTRKVVQLQLAVGKQEVQYKVISTAQLHESWGLMGCNVHNAYPNQYLA